MAPGPHGGQAGLQGPQAAATGTAASARMEAGSETGLSWLSACVQCLILTTLLFNL